LDLIQDPVPQEITGFCIYSLTQALSLPVITGILAVKATGYYIFRGANGQKDTFR
jgi:hypothetical protein